MWIHRDSQQDARLHPYQSLLSVTQKSWVQEKKVKWRGRDNRTKYMGADWDISMAIKAKKCTYYSLTADIIHSTVWQPFYLDFKSDFIHPPPLSHHYNQSVRLLPDQAPLKVQKKRLKCVSESFWAHVKHRNMPAPSHCDSSDVEGEPAHPSIPPLI